MPRWLRSRELLQKLEGKDAAYHSRYMAQLVLDVPLDVDLEDCKLKGFDRTILEPILEKLEFKSFRQNYRTPAAVWWRN